MPKQGIHIGAITINQAAAVVDQFDNFQNILVKQSECIGIGEHQIRRPGHRIMPSAHRDPHSHERSVGTGTTSNPLIAELAGLVPWAESGISMRCVWFHRATGDRRE